MLKEKRKCVYPIRVVNCAVHLNSQSFGDYNNCHVETQITITSASVLAFAFGLWLH